MEHIFAVRDEAQLRRYREFVSGIQPRLDGYLAYLDREFGVAAFPRAIVWTDERTATKLISDIPIPAYTNDYRVVFTPDLDVWRNIYLHQLDDLIESPEVLEVRDYYIQMLTQNHVLQILGHEFAHHIELFEDDAYEQGIWFEEGMVEYISRRFFLTEEEFRREAEVNRKIVQLHQSRYGNHPLEEFGKETYEGNYASIFFEYWRSFLAASGIVDRFDGDLLNVFHSYHQWAGKDCTVPLTEWFSIE